MHKQFYTQKKTFTKYDNEHYLLYLNEEEATKVMEEGSEAVAGFEYSGNFEDGGTMIRAKEATYENFVSGLIRTKYSADQVEAIILNFQSGNAERMHEFIQDMGDLNIFREECKDVIRQLLQI